MGRVAILYPLFPCHVIVRGRKDIGKAYMYVFFENHRDESGNVVATDVISSSYEDNFRINWNRDKVQFEIMKKLLKSPPIAVRTYSDETHMWSYLGQEGFFLLKTLKEAFDKLPQMKIEFREAKDLEEAVRRGSISHDKQSKFNAENFYYNRFAAVAELTKDTAAPKLALIFGCKVEALEDSAAAKKYYRANALRLHPDRNGGDGSKMSELNMLWRIYNGGS